MWFVCVFLQHLADVWATGISCPSTLPPACSFMLFWDLDCLLWHSRLCWFKKHSFWASHIRSWRDWAYSVPNWFIRILFFLATATQQRRGFKTIRSDRIGGLGKDKHEKSIVDELKTSVSMNRISTVTKCFLRCRWVETRFAYLVHMQSKREYTQKLTLLISEQPATVQLWWSHVSCSPGALYCRCIFLLHLICQFKVLYGWKLEVLPETAT